jgi:hypothetical protein
MNTMNDKYGFVEAVAREIDGTKEKINFICTYIHTRKEMVMQEDFYVKQQISGSLQRKKTIEA